MYFGKKSNKSFKKADASKLELNKIIIEDIQPIYCACFIDDSSIAVSFEDATIKIYSITSCQCKYILQGHSNSVKYISLLSKDYLVSSSADKSIKIWKFEGGKCIKTLIGHQKGVNKAIQISSERIISCSNDETIKIWSSQYPFSCIKTIKGHNDIIKSVIEISNKKYFISGSSGNEGSIKFWNSMSYECEKTVNDICCWSDGLIEISTESSERLFVGGVFQVNIIDLLTKEFITKIIIKDVGSIFYFVEIGEINKILCGTSEGYIMLLDKFEYEYNFKEKAHYSAVTRLLIKDEYILSCSKDGSIKIWE